MTPLTPQVLRDYLHDALPDAELAAVEKRLRDDAAARALLDEVRRGEARGEHTVGAIWRRGHVSCPTRDQLGGYLLNALDDDLYVYVGFHLTVVGCPACQANLDDLTARQQKAAAADRARHRRIVDSGAGSLKRFGPAG